MNPKTSKLASLLGSASLLAMSGAGGVAAQQVAQDQTAQAAPTEVPEQVLITGSLIRGTVAVGVPVTNIGPQDYVQSGSLTTSDLFRNVPAAFVQPGGAGTLTNANVGKQTRVNIRNLDPNDGVRTLMMVDGYRFPPQGEADCTIDPSFIPALALDRIDILTDGASATYGSDAIAGVLNIILKRGYDGAVTQLQTTQANGESEYKASQLWGRTWDGGDITLTYEYFDSSPIKGTLRTNWTLDFTPWGLDNRVPIRSSVPATISTGNPTQPASLGLGTGGANALGRNCTNCYAVPVGSGANFNSSLNNGLGPLTPSSAPGVLTWSNVVAGSPNPAAGTANEFDPYSIAWYNAAQQRNSVVGTFDQRLTPDISFFGEGFYSNRRAEYLNPSNLSPSSGNDLLVAVPTTNPYFPIGAPSNIRVNYNIGFENPSFTGADEVADRYLGGFNLSLPFNWEGKLYYSESFDDTHDHVDTANPNAVSAALGWTIPAGIPVGNSPAVASWTKPATVPYLNLFCDPRAFTCNSPNTLNYITGTRAYTSNFWINEKGANFDGALFSLPAGDVKAAVGGSYTTESFLFTAYDNTSSPSLLVPSNAASADISFWAAFAQINIPVFSDAFAPLPLVRRFDFEFSWRHDQYTQFGGTSNPKMGFNWNLSEELGLTLRGDWGTSFRAPDFAETIGLVKNAIAGWNSTLYAQNSTIAMGTVTSGGCTLAADSLAGRLVNPGAGFTGWNGAVANGGTSGVTCGSQAQPVGLALLGAGGTAIGDGMRAYLNTAQNVLKPESAMNWGLTAEIAPTISFLRGLDIQATWYQIKISDALVNYGNPNTGSVNDPSLGFSYIVPTDFAKAGVDVAGCSNNNTPTTCAEFERIVNSLLADPRNPVPSAIATSVLWVNDGATGNFGWLKLQGIDFNASYDIDLGNFGAWNTGITGTYYLHEFKVNDLSSVDPEAGTVQDLFHTNLGSVGGVFQNGVESLPRMHYRARLGWSDGPLSVTGFVNYYSHFFNTQNAPPNVNFQCAASGGTVGGGTFPCAISNYSDIEPAYYTFDLSFGYDTGDMPANPYLQHVGIQLIIQNIVNKLPAFEYRISTGAGNPAAFDISQSDVGRTFGLIITKTW